MESRRIDFINSLARRKPTGFLLVLSSPSGGGKTTIAKALLSLRSFYIYSVSTTTRKIREGEVDGRDYSFVDEKEFLSIAKEGGFAEWARVHENYYGTEKKFIDKAIAEDKIVVMDIDVQGAEQLGNAYPDAVKVFIIPPSLDSLEDRLRLRGTESTNSFELRMENARKEIACASNYEYLVVNDNLSNAIEHIDAIILAERTRMVRLRESKKPGSKPTSSIHGQKDRVAGT